MYVLNTKLVANLDDLILRFSLVVYKVSQLF